MPNDNILQVMSALDKRTAEPAVVFKFADGKSPAFSTNVGDARALAMNILEAAEAAQGCVAEEFVAFRAHHIDERQPCIGVFVFQKGVQDRVRGS